MKINIDVEFNKKITKIILEQNETILKMNCKLLETLIHPMIFKEDKYGDISTNTDKSKRED